MNDRELLELAAKAAGYQIHIGQLYNGMESLFIGKPKQVMEDPDSTEWNPLTNDGDALRLAVKLALLIDCSSQSARPLPDSLGWFGGDGKEDDCAATRRAIVRAAAEIGKAM